MKRLGTPNPHARKPVDMKTRQDLILFALLLSFLLCTGCEHVSGYLGFWGRQQESEKDSQEDLRAELYRYLRIEDCYFGGGDGSFAPQESDCRVSREPIHVVKTGVEDDAATRGPSPVSSLNNAARPPLRVKAREPAHGFGSLDHEFFDPRYGPLGLYNPGAMLAHTRRLFFSLERFDPEKTIVVFVHGMGGTPRDFKYLVDGLDRNLYQPWFYYYPSGMPLQKLGSMLADIIKLGSRTPDDQPARFIIVGHSMGGLIALSAINQLCIDGPPPYLKAYISFDSPFGGVEAAKLANKLPVVVPSWADIATGSPFLEKLYRGDGLKQIPFFLFFGYRTGDSSDGTVTLNSQLEPKVHLSAIKSYGFNTTHVGILNDAESRKVFNEILSVAVYPLSNLKLTRDSGRNIDRN
jgi:pimeloyl-ACP methyl ester carboxylesterase